MYRHERRKRLGVIVVTTLRKEKHFGEWGSDGPAIIIF